MEYPGPTPPPTPSKEWSSKKIVVVVAAVFAVMLLLLGGMLTAAYVVLTNDDTVSADTTDEEYLELVREELPELDEMPDEDLISTGHEICGIFEDYGSTPGTLVDAVEGFSSATGGLLDFEETAFLFGAAAVSYCPEVVDQMGGTI